MMRVWLTVFVCPCLSTRRCLLVPLCPCMCVSEWVCFCWSVTIYVSDCFSIWVWGVCQFLCSYVSVCACPTHVRSMDRVGGHSDDRMNDIPIAQSNEWTTHLNTWRHFRCKIVCEIRKTSAHKHTHTHSHTHNGLSPLHSFFFIRNSL